MTTLVWAQAKDRPVVLGQLARAVRTANLRAEPREGAPVVWTVAAGTPLTVRYGGAWIPVVMKDESTAFVRREALALIDFQVTRESVSSSPAPSGVEIAEFAYAARGGKSVAHGRALDRGIGNGEFAALAFRSVGLSLPDDPAAQARIGTPVKRLEDLRPGDRLYFWVASQNRISEAAIYVGGGYAVVADPKAGKVRSAYLDEAWRARLVAARR